MTEALSRDEVAARAGVDAAQVDELVAVGILQPRADGTFTTGDGRRIVMIRGLLEVGLPLPALGAAIGQGILSLDFAESSVYRRFATLTAESFAAASSRTGIPLELLAALRDATGWGPFDPEARLREDEADVLPWLAIQVRLGFRRPAIERILRAMGDTLRRLAEAEAEWFRSEVANPLIAQGRQNEIANIDPENHLSEEGERAILAIFRAQEAQTWMSNIVDGFQQTLRSSGIHDPAERPPAICFLDITGYTRLTQERGDQAAADLAEHLSQIVKRSSNDHGGRPVKWLGDGVMCYFRDPGEAVAGALEMIDAIPAAGLPPAHIGVHTGPLIVQQGDYYGATVNIAARIAEYARPGEVLVTQAVVDATGAGNAGSLGLSFAEIGPVDLKGVSGGVVLHAAHYKAV
jgi:adenylate cyclase